MAPGLGKMLKLDLRQYRKVASTWPRIAARRQAFAGRSGLCFHMYYSLNSLKGVYIGDYYRGC